MQRNITTTALQVLFVTESCVVAFPVDWKNCCWKNWFTLNDRMQRNLRTSLVWHESQTKLRLTGLKISALPRVFQHSEDAAAECFSCVDAEFPSNPPTRCSYEAQRGPIAVSVDAADCTQPTFGRTSLGRTKAKNSTAPSRQVKMTTGVNDLEPITVQQPKKKTASRLPHHTSS